MSGWKSGICSHWRTDLFPATRDHERDRLTNIRNRKRQMVQSHSRHVDPAWHCGGLRFNELNEFNSITVVEPQLGAFKPGLRMPDQMGNEFALFLIAPLKLETKLHIETKDQIHIFNDDSRVSMTCDFHGITSLALNLKVGWLSDD